MESHWMQRINRKMDKLSHMHTMEIYAAIKINELALQLMWMALTNSWANKAGRIYGVI